MLYFFLSYAREDDPVYVRRFFQDLSTQVRMLAGVENDDMVGFLDEQNVQIGERWPMELANALSSCSCFVAMTSPRYFRRDYCGREWAAFSDRLAAYQRQWQRHAPALLPVRWIPTNAIHPIARDIQNTNWRIETPSYHEYGLRQMLDLKRFRDDYRAFVFHLARLIVNLAETYDIPPANNLGDLSRVPNVFAVEPAAELATGGSRPAGEVTGPGRLPRLYGRTRVHFIVVAGRREEMSAIRSKLDYYGATDMDWAPYKPGLDDALAKFARQIAEERLFDSDVADISRLTEHLERARLNNELVVLLVDAWSPALDAHRHALIEYDARAEVVSAVMLPFYTGDGETLADTTVLQAELAQVLPHILERRDRVMLRQNIPTPEQFSSDLEEILEVAQNRIFKKGEVNPWVPGLGAGSRPILEGPTAELEGMSRD